METALSIRKVTSRQTLKVMLKWTLKRTHTAL